jgi:diguanylate cyclase (GGDEF)-like protein
LAAVILLEGRLLPLSEPEVRFYFYAVLLAGIALAWRFHSSRVLFSLITLFLAQHAVQFFSAGRVGLTGPGHIAVEAVSILLPLNFIALSLSRERGLGLSSLGRYCAALFFESVFVAVICRPGEKYGPPLFHFWTSDIRWLPWIKLPPLAVIAFAAAFAILLAQFFLYRKPFESGLIWSLAGMMFFFHAGATNLAALGYAGTAGLALVASIIENTYALAYHDELTALPARRAFNEALLKLERPYGIAAIDVDHFKSFNDTYGHDTGDQVLCMVASKLARVSGGGQGFRVGGEEFSVLFPGKSAKEILPHLELLRTAIQDAVFYVRTGHERRSLPHGTDRRRQTRRKLARPGRRVQSIEEELSVTVSIGVAEPASSQEPQQVVRAADKALYAAKRAGRNQVILAGGSRSRGLRTDGRSIA